MLLLFSAFPLPLVFISPHSQVSLNGASFFLCSVFRYSCLCCFTVASTCVLFSFVCPLYATTTTTTCSYSFTKLPREKQHRRLNSQPSTDTVPTAHHVGPRPRRHRTCSSLQDTLQCQAPHSHHSQVSQGEGVSAAECPRQRRRRRRPP